MPDTPRGKGWSRGDRKERIERRALRAARRRRGGAGERGGRGEGRGQFDFATRPLVQAALHEPRPLLDPDHRLAVVFSPKSACSSVVIWFFRLIGHDRAARDYDPWPHHYRSDVYYRSSLYHRALVDNLRDYAIVRVVRNSYERAVSSFRHALGTGYADREIAVALGGHDVARDGLSFREFLDFLEREDLAACNPHHRQQLHPLEAQAEPHHTIDVSSQDLFAGLNFVEAAVGASRTDFGAFQWLRELQAGREVARGEPGADPYGARLSRAQARQGPWPGGKALLTPEARERIARLYAADIARYNFAPPAGAP